MFLAIDSRRLVRQPHQIEIVPYDHTAFQSADQRPLVRPGSEYTVINCTWGREFSYQDVLGELDRLRANRGLHAITFEPMKGGRYLTLNAFMGKPHYTNMSQDQVGQNIVNAFSIPFIQVDTPTFLYPLRIFLRRIIAVASPFASHPAPAAGRIIAVDGFIQDLGSGAGQTRIQISNGATNYLATPGDFVASPPDRLMQNQVLGTNLDFAEGDQIDADVTDIPAGGLSKDAVITVWTWIYRP